MRIFGAIMAINNGLKEKLKTKKDIHIARKVWHFLGILTIAIIYNNISRAQALSFSLSIAMILLTLDVIRLNYPAFNKVFVKFAAPVMREREKYTYTGSTALFFGVFIIIYLFPERIVQMSLLFLATADPIASYYGIRYGKDKIFGDKSLQGSLAGFACCTVIAMLFYMTEGMMTGRILIVSLLTGLGGAISEAVVVGKLDDNLTFPVINSFFLFFIFKIFGGF